MVNFTNNNFFDYEFQNKKLNIQDIFLTLRIFQKFQNLYIFNSSKYHECRDSTYFYLIFNELIIEKYIEKQNFGNFML